MDLKPHDVGVVVGLRGCGKSTWTRENIIAPAPRVVTFDPHGEYPGDPVTVDELVTDPGILETHSRLSVRPAERMPQAIADSFEAFMLAVQEPPVPFVLAIDECGLLRVRCAELLEYAATQSRHWGVPLVFVAQRAVQIPVTAREQASFVVSFRQKKQADLDALGETIGATLAEKVGRLSRERHEFVIWRETDE